MAVEIRDGHGELVETLWEQVGAFVRMMARRYFRQLDGGRGVELEDLFQAGFLAVTDAIRTFDPEKGSFLTHLNYWLRRWFRQTAGLQTDRAANDPIASPVSLDNELEDGGTLGDLQPDPHNEIEEAENEIYRQELRVALDREIRKLQPEDAEVIRRKYFRGESTADIAKTSGRPVQAVYTAERRALYALRRKSALEAFLDDATPFYAHPSFQNTGSSPVEFIVLRRERMRKQRGE